MAEFETKLRLEAESVHAKLESLGHPRETVALALGGSHAYGLATLESDIDLRGFAPATCSELLTLHDFEQIRVDEQDAMVYSLKKFVSLLLACNPNIIELVGVDESCIVNDTASYRALRNNVEKFVSRRCAQTFGGYATQQLRRIENALNREDESRVAENARRSLEASLDAIPRNWPGLVASNFAFRDDLTLSGTLEGAPLGELKAFADQANETVKNAKNLAARNRKRESTKLAKHASHLVRLLRMGSEMLETGSVNVTRVNDRDELLALKRGRWLHEDNGVRHYDDEFWELVDAEEKRFCRAKSETSLREEPDETWAREFVQTQHRLVLQFYGG